MMYDNLNTPNGGERPRRTPENAQPLSDREVPLGSAAATDDSVDRWLDGELAESAVTSARHVAFWSRINEETERRRHVTAPAGLQERIMEMLPAVEPEVADSWWSRPVEVTPAVAIAAAAGLVVLGAALNASIRMR